MKISCPVDPMLCALDAASQAGEKGDVPVGAVIVKDGEIIATASNRVERDTDPTAHAELLVIRQASKILEDVRLVDCDLYVTLEPCAMCAQALAHARIRRLYFGAYDPKGGGVEHGAKIFERSTCHHKPEVYGGIAEEKCTSLLKSFFQKLR
ncbi:MAG TPA: tRNA-specific adenosine deaminase [Holosporales bacterium]|nr:tRNA-specific adenosine deaminase [Holosporales bacterium]